MSASEAFDRFELILCCVLFGLQVVWTVPMLLVLLAIALSPFSDIGGPR